MLRRLTRRQLENTLRDSFPSVHAGWSGLQLPDLSSPLGFSNDAAVLLVSEQTAREYLASVEALAGLAATRERLAAELPCAGAELDAAPAASAQCGRALIAHYGPRLFRRSLSDEEFTRYETLFRSIAAGGGWQTAAKWTLVALMQSPHMLYRRELGVSSGERFQLTGNELASELAYTFANTMPTPELIERAERGELDSAEARVAEARDLLASARGREGLQQFFGEWLRYQNVATADRPAIAQFALMRTRMLEEMDAFLDAVVHEDAGGLQELLTAPYSFADPELARYYGWPPPSAAGFARVERPEPHGIGLLAQGALLASASNQEASSPTRRGLLVLERVLCRPRPTPPANVPPLASADASAARTTRERYEKAHAGQGACAGCHAHFDPLGFAFEHFDEGGRFRQTEAGARIDSSGELHDPSGRALPYAGQSDFAQLLAASNEAADCVSGLLAAYAFGGGGGASCLAEGARRGFADGRYGIAEYLAQLAAEPHFEARSATAIEDAAPAAHDPTAPADAAGASGETVPTAAADASAPDAGTRDAGIEGADGASGGGPMAPGVTAMPADTTNATLRAQYLPTNTAPSDNVIAPTLQLVHVAGAEVPLASLELRYYFTNEHHALCPDGCKVESYYAGLHPSGKGVTAHRKYVTIAAERAYLSITFATDAPVLRAGESVELQQQVHTEPYRDFDETDDYSFDAAQNALADHERVTLYRDGSLIWGTPPAQ